MSDPFDPSSPVSSPPYLYSAEPDQGAHARTHAEAFSVAHGPADQAAHRVADAAALGGAVGRAHQEPYPVAHFCANASPHDAAYVLPFQPK